MKTKKIRAGGGADHCNRRRVGAAPGRQQESASELDEVFLSRHAQPAAGSPEKES